MLKNTLSPVQRAVLSAISLSADTPFPELAEQVGLKPHQLYYWERVFLESDAIIKRPLINPWALGLEEYSIHFSAVFENAKVKEQFHQVLVRHPAVAGAYELGGDKHYGVVLQVSKSRAALDALDALSELPGVSLGKTEVVIRHEVRMYRRKYLHDIEGALSQISYHSDVQAASLSEAESATLKAIRSHPQLSLREHSRQLEVSSSTFRNRVRSLEQKRVLEAFVYGIRTERFGIQSFRLLASFGDYAKELRCMIERFAEIEPNIVAYMGSIGDWHAEFFLEVFDVREVTEIRTRLQQAFKGNLVGLSVIPHLQYLKLARPDYSLEY